MNNYAPKNVKKSKSFAALTASALALPAISMQASASAAPDDVTVGYRYSQYQEDQLLEENVVVGGDTERYTINVHQFDVSGGLENTSFNVNVQMEDLSGASSTFTVVDDLGDAKLNMSGATIVENRIDVSGALRYHFPTVEIQASGGLSQEDDYDSWFAGFDGSLEVNKKSVVLSAGATYAKDTLYPVSNTTLDDGRTEQPEANTSPGRHAAWGQNKEKISLFQGTSFVVNKNTVAQLGFGFSHLSGYLSDPYREGKIFPSASDTTIENFHYDQRPDVRMSGTVNAGVRYHISKSNSTLHADYRFYGDDWSVLSNTLELSWYQRIDINSAAKGGVMGWLSDNDSYLMLVPQIRYYQQTGADFYYQYNNNNGLPLKDKIEVVDYYSSDSRLANYGAISGGGKAIFKMGPVKLNAKVERYVSDPSYSGNNQEIPSMVNYWLFTTGIDYTF
jgi:hypothetical protein